VKFTPYQLARLQAHAGDDRAADTEVSALKKAIEGAVKASELPHAVEKFNFPSRSLSMGGVKETYSSELPAIAAGEFSKWLEQQGEVPSVHISAWIASCQTQPEQAHPAPTVVLVEPATPAPVTVTKHSTKTRRNSLTPVIELAQSKCLNPKDTAEVWNELCKLASKQTAPFEGTDGDSLRYFKDDEPHYFKKSDLRKRLGR
jgi:hypothetical protein